MFSDADFTTATFQLRIGDVLIAYTDGITEVQNPQAEFWGQDKFEKLLRSCGCGLPKQIMESVLDEVSGFADGQPQRDDMTLVIMKVQDGCDEVGLSPAGLRRVTELVHAKIEDGLSLNAMAESAGLSAAYFSQMFRKSTGETPHQFLLRQRIERAKDMLREGEARVLDVAIACGFKTQQHFARVFRRMCAVTPTEYRKEFLRLQSRDVTAFSSQRRQSMAASS
jgi:AraC-like DNA-binding protein